MTSHVQYMKLIEIHIKTLLPNLILDQENLQLKFYLDFLFTFIKR